MCPPARPFAPPPSSPSPPPRPPSLPPPALSRSHSSARTRPLALAAFPQQKLIQKAAVGQPGAAGMISTAVANTTRKARTCRRCKMHGLTVPSMGHRVCAYAECTCVRCTAYAATLSASSNWQKKRKRAGQRSRTRPGPREQGGAHVLGDTEASGKGGASGVAQSGPRDSATDRSTLAIHDARGAGAGAGATRGARGAGEAGAALGAALRASGTPTALGASGTPTIAAAKNKRPRGKRKACPHGKRKERCIECGGNQVCIHGRVKDKRRPCAQCVVGAPASLVRTSDRCASCCC